MRWIGINASGSAYLTNNRLERKRKIEDCFSPIYFYPDIFTSCLDVHNSIVIEFFKEYTRKIHFIKTSHKSTRTTVKFKRCGVKYWEGGRRETGDGRPEMGDRRPKT